MASEDGQRPRAWPGALASAAAKAVGAARGRAQEAVGEASGAALAAGSRACEAAAKVAARLRAEDPQDTRATVTCSELALWLRIQPGEGQLEVLSAWFGHPDDPARRRDITAEAQARVTSDNGLSLYASRLCWGDPSPWSPCILSVTYQRKGGVEPTPGESLRMQIARVAVARIVERANYEALKQVAGSPAMGSWISATPILMGMPVPGGTVHAVYVSMAELIFWSTKKGLRTLSWLAFLKELGVAEVQVVQRPHDERGAQQAVDRARGLVAEADSPDLRERFSDSRSFAALCCCGGPDGSDALEVAKAAGTMGAAVLAAAHVDEAAAAIALPLLGAQAAVAVGVVGAVVVSPLLLAGLWHLQRRNDARIGFAVMNLSKEPVRLSVFELNDSQRVDWGLLRSSCVGIGGKMSSSLEPHQLLELNPPSSSDIFQLRCRPEKKSAIASASSVLMDDTAQSAAKRELGGEEGEDEEVDESMACLQSVTRARVYWVMQYGSALVIREVPKRLIPAYAHA